MDATLGEKLACPSWFEDINMVLCLIISGVLCVVLLLYVSLEFHYFLRMSLCLIIARVFKKKVHVLAETVVKGYCLTTDVDTLLYHMNNARYLREIDFARVDFYERTDLYRTIRSKGGAVVQGACTIRYRRFIRPFTAYTIKTKILYWDEKSIFMEHRFVTPCDNFVRAIAICRQRVIDCNAEEILNILLASNGAKLKDNESGFRISKPEIPLEILKWNESNDISSANLRNGC